MLLTTFDPFTRDFDRIIDRAFGPAWRTASAMPMDVTRTGDGLVLRFDLPGIDPASIDVTVDRGVLTVGAKRTEEHTDGEEQVVRERITGTFSRRVRLGDAADSAKIEAGYQDGVLTVRVPLAEAAKPRKVEIQAGQPKGLTA